MADRIAVMDKGRLLQVAPPQELYESPNCRMVADFIGKMNLFHGQVIGAEGTELRLAADGLGELTLDRGYVASGEIGIAIRPEKVQLSHEQPGAELIALPGRIAQLAYFGDTSHVYVDTDSGLRIACNRPNLSRADSVAFQVGDRCWVAWRPADVLLLTS